MPPSFATTVAFTATALFIAAAAATPYLLAFKATKRKAFTKHDIPRTTGKTAVITGGTSGLGFASAVALVARGARVIITATTPEKGQVAVTKIMEAAQVENQVENSRASTGTSTAVNDAKNANGAVTLEVGTIKFVVVDNRNLSTVSSFAQKLIDEKVHIDILMLNVGICFVPYATVAVSRSRTQKLFESTFFINHIAHAFLVSRLEPWLIECSKIASAPLRVVVLSSKMYTGISPRTTKSIDWEAEATVPQSQYDNVRAYAVSKLANILFTQSLSERWAGHRIFVNVVHPGLVDTNITTKVSYGTGVVSSILRFIDIVVPKYSSEEGALTQLYVATSKEIEEEKWNGKYFVPIAKLYEFADGELPTRADLRESLWEYTEKLVQSLS
ncbi:Retinol dehydrogenase 14 [Quaeritorhiza haematococci]|nr:Retinol dehydrogenase 14 [Quaeritorhiza haematococci]